MQPQASAHSLSLKSSLVITFLGLLAVLAWDFSGADIRLALWAMPTGGFVRDGVGVLSIKAHDWMRHLSAGVFLWISIWTFWPRTPSASVQRWARVVAWLSIAVNLLLIVIIKRLSQTSSCPNTLALFGGTYEYISHWDWSTTVANPGRGGCFPAGHVSAGAAFIPMFFAFYARQRHLAYLWLSGSLLVSAGLGVIQHQRGEHFVSHTLWTLWICWAVSALIWALACCIRSHQTTHPR